MQNRNRVKPIGSIRCVFHSLRIRAERIQRPLPSGKVGLRSLRSMYHDRSERPPPIGSIRCVFHSLGSILATFLATFPCHHMFAWVHSRYLSRYRLMKQKHSLRVSFATFPCHHMSHETETFAACFIRYLSMHHCQRSPAATHVILDKGR